MTQIYDLAILGGGPAGVAAGVYAARKRLKTIFITKDWAGQSTVSEGIENWIGEIKISGLDLSKKLETHLKAYAGDIVTIKEGQWITSIVKNGSTFKITSDSNGTKNEYEAKTVLITTGSSRRKLEVPGAEEFDNKGLTYCATCDGPLYADQDVVVVGAGNAGFESAAQLLAYCKSVTLLARTDFSKADEVTVKKVTAHPNFKGVMNATPTKVVGDKFVTGMSYKDKSGKEIDLKVTGVFVEIGSIPNTAYAKDVVKLDQYNRVIVDPKTQQASIKGVWAAGDCTDGLYHQNNIAAGDAVKAIEDIYLFVHGQ